MKILVIQQKMIGDVLASTVICQNIKLHFPEAEVHYLVNAPTLPVVKGNPNINHTVVYKNTYRDNLWKFYKFLKSIRKEKYDVLIDVYGKLESNLITLFSGAPTRISYRKWYTSWLYTDLFSYAKKAATPMGLAIENRLLLLSPLVNDVRSMKGTPKIYLTEQERLNARNYLRENRVDPRTPLIMVSVQGSSEIKSYPSKFMAQVVSRIANAKESTILFNYGPGQEKEARRVYELCDPKAREKVRFDLKPASLRFFLSVLENCEMLIGNEGGTVNMAKALGVPTFSIFSPWISKEAWDTYNDNPYNKAVHLGDYQPALIVGQDQAALKKRANELYAAFKPEYLEEELMDFLNLERVADQ